MKVIIALVFLERENLSGSEQALFLNSAPEHGIVESDEH
jgi:hypothetical protein